MRTRRERRRGRRSSPDPLEPHRSASGRSARDPAERAGQVLDAAEDDAVQVGVVGHVERGGERPEPAAGKRHREQVGALAADDLRGPGAGDHCGGKGGGEGSEEDRQRPGEVQRRRAGARSGSEPGTPRNK